MEFIVTAKNTYQFEFTVESEYEVVVGKKAVVEAGFCANSEEGDTSAWLGYVEDYLREQGLEKFIDAGKVKLYSDHSRYHEQTELLEVTKILKQLVDEAIEQEEPPEKDEDGIGLDVRLSSCTIEAVEW